MSEINRILAAMEKGDKQASPQLLPLVYQELRRLAVAKMAQEPTDHTLQPTALVHEAYLRLVGPVQEQRWDSQGHFFAAAAEAMRRILVESARRKKRLRHGGGQLRVELSDQPAAHADEELLALDDALSRLAEEDELAARVVELRHFAGIGHEQVAATLGLTIYQARQKWSYARAWLRIAVEKK